MAINDLYKFPKGLFNHTILSKFIEICRDSGFMGKHVINEEGLKILFGVEVFAANKQTQLTHIIWAYSIYVMRHTQPKNQYYNNTRKILNNNPNLKEYLSKIVDLTDEDVQIYCVLALSAFYYFLNRKDITIMIEKRI